MPAPGPRSRGARAHPPPHQGLQTLARRSANSRLVLVTQNLGGITGRGTDPLEAVQPVIVRPRGALAARLAWGGALAGGAAALVAIFLAAAFVLGRNPLPVPIVLGFCLGVVVVLGLALTRYHAAVALGLWLLAAVRIEP